MNTSQLRRIASNATPENAALYAPLLNKYMPLYGISGALRESAFIAQIIHESGSFRYTREIASGKAYEGREDLGNVIPGDGVRFKGRGLIQLTGRANYKELSRDFGIDFIADPELLSQPDYAVRSACWFWSKRGLNALADQKRFRDITRRINGGYNGLADREKWYSRALEVLDK